MSALPILDRLERVRQFGKGWRADCPIGHRSKGTLSISETADGTTLMHCHAGCGAAEVLATIGMTLADLHPERPQERTEPRTPKERREARERARMYKVRRLLPELALESRIVLMAAGKITSSEGLTPEDDARLLQAVGRIEAAKAVLYGR